MKIIFIVLFSFSCSYLPGQKLFYSDEGMQINGSSHIDTIITHLNKTRVSNTNYILKRLEPLSRYVVIGSDTVNLSQVINLKRLDSNEYFTLYNSGNKPIKLLLQDGSMITTREAVNYQNKWLPVEFWNYSWCGNSYYPISIEPGQLLLFTTYKLKGTGKTKMRLRLKTESNGILVSDSFEAFVDPDYFVLNTSLKIYKLEVMQGFTYLK